MTWKELKDFCNSLDELQLEQNVSIEDEDMSYACTYAYCLDDDVYELIDTGELGTKDELYDLYPDSIFGELDVKLSASKGTPFLSIIPD